MRNKFFLVSLFMILAVLLSACGSAAMPGAAQTAPRVLSVSGMGEVLLKPDIAYIYMGVGTEDESAAQAVAKNNADTKRLMEALKAAGVAESDLRTSNFSIWQNMPYNVDGMPGKPVYQVDNTVYVTVRDLARLGDLLDIAIRAGANNISGIQFDVADKTQALSDARKAAVEAARRQAAELAEAAGVKLGSIQGIQYYDNAPGMYFDARVQGEGGGGAAAAEVPINPGQMQITAIVTINFEIK